MGWHPVAGFERSGRYPRSRFGSGRAVQPTKRPFPLPPLEFPPLLPLPLPPLEFPLPPPPLPLLPVLVLVLVLGLVAT